MTKLLEQGIEAVRELPADRQDLAGELLLTLAARKYQLTDEQLDDLKLAINEADQGEFSTPDELSESWKKFGL